MRVLLKKWKGKMENKVKKILSILAFGLVLIMAIPAVEIPMQTVTTESKTIKLSDKNLELMPGEWYELEVENAGSKKVTWKTSNKKVVTVNKKGKLHAVGDAGKSCTVTAVVGKKSLKCKVKIIKTTYVGSYQIYWCNWTYSGYDYYGKAVSEVSPQYIEIYKYKGCYYWIIETEGGSDASDYIVYSYYLRKIGKKLPKCIKSDTTSINALCDAEGNVIFEKAHDYTDKEWKARCKELGY